MNNALIDQIASAVLYEGYLLYPYRPSVKNRQRWTFGGLYPRAFSEAQAGTDAWFSQTECLIEGTTDSALSVRVRFLQLQTRTIDPGGPPLEGGRMIEAAGAWQEAVEREVGLDKDMPLRDPVREVKTCTFGFPSTRSQEVISGGESGTECTIIREQCALAGSIEVSAEQLVDGLFKVRVRVRNDTPFDSRAAHDRDTALLNSLVSTHVVLGIRDGAFVSKIDPPERWKNLAEACENVQSFPVLVGEPGATDAMLAAPIILYDYPQIAPESPGDLFDSTEIDEILTLRILTLTDEEKRAVAAIDHRAAALLERTESLAREQLMGLHGTIRGLRPLSST